ncbi:MAG: hypothetical protein GY822_11035, partial [Deltaproteobacteria bacterium]|nr:hypothetical protein [Deltaproteobacteria bacterium]
LFTSDSAPLFTSDSSALTGAPSLPTRASVPATGDALLFTRKVATYRETFIRHSENAERHWETPIATGRNADLTGAVLLLTEKPSDLIGEPPHFTGSI